MIDKTSVQNRFSKNAKNYDDYAVVQKKMGRRLTEYLEEAKVKSNVLEIGCGTGYMTGLLLEALESPEIEALDIAPGMVERASKKYRDMGVAFRCEDIESAKLERSYDLIVSNATFQWLNDIEKTSAELIGKLDSRGILVFSTFGDGTFRELNDCFQKSADECGCRETVRHGQKLWSAEELEERLVRAVERSGVSAEIAVYEETEYEHFDSVKEFLYSIKKIGANNSNADRGFKSPRLMKRMMENYEKNYRRDGKVRATYHCIYAVIKRVID